jgi:hypothetical protein
VGVTEGVTGKVVRAVGAGAVWLGVELRNGVRKASGVSVGVSGGVGVVQAVRAAYRIDSSVRPASFCKEIRINGLYSK